MLAIIDANGNLLQRFCYMPYGEQVEVSHGLMGIQSSATQCYMAHEHIEGMGLIHGSGHIDHSH